MNKNELQHEIDGSDHRADEQHEDDDLDRRVLQLRAVMDELRKVTWPDRAQTIDATWRIIVFVLFIAAIIGLLDLVLQLILVRGLPKIFTGT